MTAGTPYATALVTGASKGIGRRHRPAGSLPAE